MKPETNHERRRRKLKELEGKNISYYGVLLETIIQSELHSVKIIITLSSAAIVLLFTVGIFKGSCAIIGPIVFCISVFFFIITIVFGLLFLNQASTRYEEELKGANNNMERWNSLVKARKKFSIYRKGAFITFCAWDCCWSWVWGFSVL